MGIYGQELGRFDKQISLLQGQKRYMTWSRRNVVLQLIKAFSNPRTTLLTRTIVTGYATISILTFFLFLLLTSI